MLAAAGIIGEDDRDALLAGLDAVAAELEAGRFPFAPDDEDIHMAIERRLTELAGPVGGRLHTARSRNDQVATDVAMFTRDAARAAATGVSRLMRALVETAEGHLDWPMPGYTHLQRAQPVYLSHHLLAYVWMLVRDRARFRFVAGQTAALPLGAGALAGVNFDDRPRHGRQRARLHRRRRRRTRSTRSPTATYVLDYLSAAATCATHLSRLGAELVIWSSEEFGFVEMPDAWASGSSIMPQKKNPDAAELLRAKAPRIVGHLSALHGVMHALPLTYNKDMQEDKEHLFDAADTLELCLAAARGHGHRGALPARAPRRRGVGRAHRRDRHRRPAREEGRPVPRGPRGRRRARPGGRRLGPPAVGPDARPSCASCPSTSITPRSPRC